jgi:hypothetical protein
MKVDKRLSWEYSTKFGQYWTNGTRSRTGSAGHPFWFPYAAPPPRVGPSAPRRWAAEPESERPYGLRPYELKWQQAIASAVITDQLRLSNDPCSYERLRDLKAHIAEQRRARSGYYWAEMEGVELYRRSDRLRWFIDATVDDEKLDFSGQACERGVSEVTPKGEPIGVGRDSDIARDAGFKFEEVNNTVARRRRKPLRERCKPGRKPIGAIAMTGAERKQRHDLKKKLQALATPERPQAGAVQPSPLGLAVPANSLEGNNDPNPNCPNLP